MSDPAVGYTSGDARKAGAAGDEMSGPLAWTGAADSHAIEAKVTGDAADRFAVEVDGTHEWGDGTGAKDTNLYRSAANHLKTDDTLHVGASNTIKLGAGGDTTITRTGADEITVTNLVVTGTFTGDVDTVIPADLDCTTLDATGAITAGTSVTAADLVATDDLTVGDDAAITGSLTAADITATTTVTAADLHATDDLFVGDDAAITGDLTAATVTSAGTVAGVAGSFSGAITGTNVTGSGTVQGATVTATGALNGASASVSGAATLGSATCTGTLTIGADTNLYRASADLLKTDDALSVAGAAGITLGADVNLYRNAANVLKTDDALVVVGSVTAASVASTGAVSGTTITGTGAGSLLSLTLAAAGITVVPQPMPTTAHYVHTAGQSATTTSATCGNQTLRAFPFIITETRSCTKLAAEVTSAGEAGSKIRLGIYNDNGHLYPGTLLIDGGVIDGTSATMQEVTISQSLVPGVYWFASCVQLAASSQPTMRVPSTSHTSYIPIGLGTSLPAANSQAFGYQQVTIGNGALVSTFSSTVVTSSSGARVTAKLT